MILVLRPVNAVFRMMLFPASNNGEIRRVSKVLSNQITALGLEDGTRAVMTWHKRETGFRAVLAASLTESTNMEPSTYVQIGELRRQGGPNEPIRP
jgi:hypothetical protein